MKSIKKLGLFTLALASAFTIGLASCNKNYSFVMVEPSEVAGQTLDIKIFPGGSTGVEKIEVYEDSRLIESKQRNKEDNYMGCIEKVIKHEEQGTHSYHAKIFYENGKTEVTKSKEILFLGLPLDIPPEIMFFSIQESGGSKWVLFSAKDLYGDNKGVDGIKVYEDGKLLQYPDYFHYLTKKPDLAYDIYANLHPEKKKGAYTYHIEVKDKGGNQVTKTFTIDYDTNMVKYYDLRRN